MSFISLIPFLRSSLFAGRILIYCSDPASLPIEPYDPFNKQLFEIDMNRHGWVPSVYDYDTQYDSNRIYDPNDNIVRMAPPVSLEGPPADYMYCGRIPRSVDMPVDILVYHAPAPSYSTNPNPPPAFPGYSSLASYDTPVYATAPQFVQKHQDSGKKGKKAGYMDGGKPRSDHGFDTNYDAGFVSRQPFANHDYDTYGFATPHNGNGYNSAPGGEFSTYAPAYGVSTGNVHSHMNDNRYGNGNGSAGPDNRGRGQKGQRYKQKFNKKNQQNEYAGDLHQNEYSKPPRNNDYPVRHFNDYPSDGPLNSNYFMPPSFQNTLQLPRQNDEHRDEHRNSNNSFGNPAQSSQHKLRADRRHEFHNTSDSSASMEFSSSPVTELHKPACEDSDLPLRNTHCKPKDAFGKFEPEEMTDKTTGGGADVAKVDALVKITYADIAKGKGISMGASAIAKKNPADKNAAASGDVSSGETQMHMDNAVSVKGEEEGEGKL
jgi:hypothetical protein